MWWARFTNNLCLVVASTFALLPALSETAALVERASALKRDQLYTDFSDRITPFDRHTNFRKARSIQSPYSPNTGTSGNTGPFSVQGSASGGSKDVGTSPFTASTGSGSKGSGPFSGSASGGGMGASPFTASAGSGSKGSGPFSGSASGGGMGASPFTASAGSGSKGSGPFSGSASGGGMGASPFATSAGSGSKGSGPFSGSASSGGMGASPFAGAGKPGDGASGPFSGAAPGGSGGMGTSLFTVVGSGKNNSIGGLGPFASNTGAKMMSGPGGLTGGGFNIDHELLGAHDYSANLARYHGSSSGSTYTRGQGHIDNSDLVGSQSRFDTSAYQNMLKSMYNTENINSELSNFGGPPFNGDSFERASGGSSEENVHHNTAVDNSIGSYADMRATGDNGGRASSNVVYSGSDRGYSYGTLSNPYGTDTSSNERNTYNRQNVDRNSPFEVSQGTTGSQFRGDGSSSKKNNFENGMGSSPFTAGNSNHGKGNSPYSGGSTDGKGPFDANSFSHNDNGQGPFSKKFSNSKEGQNPFDTSKFANSGGGKSPFSANQGTGVGQNPFDTSKFSNAGAHGNNSPFGGKTFSGTGAGQNPFDTSKYQSFGGSDTLIGGQYQTGSTHYHDNNQNTGLDTYGNLDLAKFSGVSGNNFNTASNTRMGMPSYTASDSKNGFSDARPMTSDYSGYTGTMDTGSYGASGSSGTSSSQYKTPFESDNYNDLIDNPFSSSSYFDSTRSNFKDPYETKAGSSDLMSFAGNQSPQGYTGSESSYSSIGPGPAGNPFHQGGHGVPSNGNMRAG